MLSSETAPKKISQNSRRVSISSISLDAKANAATRRLISDYWSSTDTSGCHAISESTPTLMRLSGEVYNNHAKGYLESKLLLR